MLKDDIRAIKSKADLDETAYIELLPGAYKGQCWNEGSLFFEEEVFGYFEPTVKAHADEFDHYAFTSLNQAQCLAISDGLKTLAEKVGAARNMSELPREVGFFFARSEERFGFGFSGNVKAVASLCMEVADWLTEQSQMHGSVTILGM